VIGKNTHLPAKFIVGRNVEIGTDMEETDFSEFADKTIPNGKRVGWIRSDYQAKLKRANDWARR